MLWCTFGSAPTIFDIRTYVNFLLNELLREVRISNYDELCDTLHKAMLPERIISVCSALGFGGKDISDTNIPFVIQPTHMPIFTPAMLKYYARMELRKNFDRLQKSSDRNHYDKQFKQVLTLTCSYAADVWNSYVRLSHTDSASLVIESTNYFRKLAVKRRKIIL